ncbi:MAG: hypothetical protein R6W95_12235 [Desulfosarcina sp.]
MKKLNVQRPTLNVQRSIKRRSQKPEGKNQPKELTNLLTLSLALQPFHWTLNVGRSMLDVQFFDLIRCPSLGPFISIGFFGSFIQNSKLPFSPFIGR